MITYQLKWFDYCDQIKPINRVHLPNTFIMPVISMFYGIIIRMFYFDNKQHSTPHIHLEYGENNAILSIPDGRLLAGNFPSNKLKLVHAWVEIHQDELMADWALAIEGSSVFKIEALK